MANPIVSASESESIVRNLQATATGVKYTFRGDYQSGEAYNVDDYVYVPTFPGFLYVATTTGITQGDTLGKTSLTEPAWDLLSTYTYDNQLQFVPEEVPQADALAAKVWTPQIEVTVGSLMAPSTGPIIVHGSEDQYFVFRLKKIVVNVDWPRTPREYVTDNTVIWECRVSYGKLLPAARLQEPMFQELVEILDFLKLHEETFFDDLTYKYADQMRLRSTSVKEVVAEFGYNYITDFLGLSSKELQSTMEYISLIHYLKGHESGLSLVFELLGVDARWEEWWESSPQGVPDTWKLWVSLDIAKASGSLADKIINFTRQYVYPVMQDFEVAYSVDLIKLGAAIGGYIDTSYSITAQSGLMMMHGVGGYRDKSYSFNLSAVVHPVLGKHDTFLSQVFGFKSIFGDIGTWGSQWIQYDYDTSNRTPIVAKTDISDPDALALITVADKRED